MSATVMYHQSWLDSVQFYTRKNFYEILESGLVELFDGTEKKRNQRVSKECDRSITLFYSTSGGTLSHRIRVISCFRSYQGQSLSIFRKIGFHKTGNQIIAQQ